MLFGVVSGCVRDVFVFFVVCRFALCCMFVWLLLSCLVLF